MAYTPTNWAKTPDSATPMRPTQYAPKPGAMQEPRTKGPTRRVQRRRGRQQMAGAPQQGGYAPHMAPAPQQRSQAPIAPPEVPLAPETASQGDFLATARIPGIGRPGTERGAPGVRRRRRA